jgi:DNA-binding transcriptional LysR family regulator
VELAHLETFTAVYRTGTLTAAAATVHLSQPAVSQHLKALEAELGRPLFVRLARGVTPTPLAHALAGEVAGPLGSLAVTAASFRKGASTLRATVVIGGPADCLSANVIPALVPMTSSGLRVRAEVGLTRPLLVRLADGEFDFVIATTPTKQKGVSTQTFFDETMVLVANPRIADTADRRFLANGDPSGLAHIPLVAFDERLPLIQRFWRTVFSGHTPPAPSIVLNDLRGLVTALVVGGGIGVIPSYLARKELRTGELIEVVKPEVAPTNRLYIASRTGIRQPHVEAVIDHLIQRAISW